MAIVFQASIEEIERRHPCPRISPRAKGLEATMYHDGNFFGCVNAIIRVVIEGTLSTTGLYFRSTAIIQSPKFCTSVGGKEAVVYLHAV